jgi:hypothetical protein
MLGRLRDLSTGEVCSYGITILAIVLGYSVFMHWIDSPSSMARGETEYTKCLELVLRNGNIDDANTMCQHIRKR